MTMMADANNTAGIPEPDIGLATAYSLVLAVALLGNVATICNFKYNDWLKSHKCHVYILGLAVADLGTALVPLPIHALVAARGLWPLSRQACMAYDYFRVVIENNGVLVTLLISVDRCRLLWFDFSSYIRGSTQRRVLLELGLTWLVPAVGHGVMALVWIIIVPLEEREAETASDCQDVPSDADIPFSASYAVLLIFLPGLLLAVLNTLTFIGVARKLKRRRRIGNGMAFRGPPSSSLTVKRQQPAVSRRSVNDHPQVLPPETKEPKIPTLSFVVADCCGHPDGMPCLRCDGKAHPRLDRDNDQPGPSAVVKKVRSARDPLGPDSQPDFPSRASNANPQRTETQRRMDRQKTRYIRPAIMLAGIVTVFALCWFPFAVYYIYVHIVCPACYSRKIQLWLRCLMYASSAINPFIYALTDRKIRHWYAKIWSHFRRYLTRNL